MKTIARPARALLALCVSLTPGLAAAAPSPAPVAGGLSSRLAPFKASLERGKQAFVADLGSTLERSRAEAHELVDRIVDGDDLSAWLDAMAREEGQDSALVAQLRSADPEQARNVLHSKIERKLADLGKTLKANLDGEGEERLLASFDLALQDLAREEENLMKNVAEVDQDAPSAPEPSDLGVDHEVLDPDDPEADAPAAPSDAPRAPGMHVHGRDQSPMRRFHSGNRIVNGQDRVLRQQRHQLARQTMVQQQQLIAQQQRMARRQVRSQHQRQRVRRQQRRMVRQNQTLAMQNQTLALQNQALARQQIRMSHQRRRHHHRMRRHMQRRAWFAQQRRAWEWNRRMDRFQRYVYMNGARFSHHRFPAGMYYRPDRVERVVSRGLWGAATVAATPFALLASLF